jgi:hypothetical protein
LVRPVFGGAITGITVSSANTERSMLMPWRA